MAENKYENALLSQEEIDVDSDFIRAVDSKGVSYKDPMGDVAKAIIEGYGGSTLAETQRTIQQAFADLSGDIGTNAEKIDERTCTPAELTLLEELLGIEGGE